MIAGVSTDLPHLDHLAGSREWGLRLARRPVAVLLRSLWQVHLHGTEHVPASGPVVLAANHIAMLDGPVLVACTGRLTFAIAKQELFTGRLGPLLAQVGQISIDRRARDTTGINKAVQILRAGKVLAVFPEGRRGTGRVEYARGGAAYLSMIAGASVVPVALLGTRGPDQAREALPHLRSAIHVVYGEPLPVPQTGWPRRRQEVARWTERIRQHLAAHVVAAQALTGLPLPGPPATRALPSG